MPCEQVGLFALRRSYTVCQRHRLEEPISFAAEWSKIEKGLESISRCAELLVEINY